MKRIAITFTGAAVMLPPGVAWCAESAATGHGSWLTLLFFVINFGLFIGFLRWLDRWFGGIVHNHFAGRARTIKDTFSRAETTLKQAEELANQARERTAQLGADKTQLRADLDVETSYMVQALRQKAREAADRIVRDTELTGNAMVEAARRRLRESLAEATGRLALALVSRNFTDDDQARLLRGFQTRLSQETPQ